jgi:Cysteine-rich domain
MKIGLFIPCFIDAFFPEVGIATLQLLERFDLDVLYPPHQTCCGQPMANSGFETDASGAEALFVRNFGGFDYTEVRLPDASEMPGGARRDASSPPRLIIQKGTVKLTKNRRLDE